jgi:hypothetical protein
MRDNGTMTLPAPPVARDLFSYRKHWASRCGTAPFLPMTRAEIKNPLKRVHRHSEDVQVPKGLKVRRLHKAFLRYHDPANWPVLREALQRMGRAELIGNGKRQLVPTSQPGTAPVRPPARFRLRTQHTGLPRAKARVARAAKRGPP